MTSAWPRRPSGSCPCGTGVSIDGASEPVPSAVRPSVAAVRMRLRAELRARWRALVDAGSRLPPRGRPGDRHCRGGAVHGRRRGPLLRRRGGLRRLGWEDEMSAGGLRRRREAAAGGVVIRLVDVAFWGRTDAGRAVTVNDAELNALMIGRMPAMIERSTSSVGCPTRLGPTRSTWARERPRRTTCRWATCCGRGIATLQEFGRFAATQPVPGRSRPRERQARDRDHPARRRSRSRGTSTDALPWTSMSRGFYESYREREGPWFAHGDPAEPRGRRPGRVPGRDRAPAAGNVHLLPVPVYTKKLKSSIDLQTQVRLVLAVLGGLAVPVLVGQALAVKPPSSRASIRSCRRSG